MSEGLEIKGHKLDINALDFGLYGRFLYFISYKGNIGLNRLVAPLDSFFNSKEFGKDELSSILKYKNPISIAKLNDFPVDSIVYNRNLLVSTYDDVYSIPISISNGISNSILPFHLNNVISFAKLGSWVFLSRDTEGLTIYSANHNWLYHSPLPSTRIVAGGRGFLNLHPDFSPKVFSIIPRRKRIREDNFKLITLTPSSFILEDIEASKSFNEKNITGRDILYPMINNDEVTLYLTNGVKHSVGISRQNFDGDISFKLPSLSAAESIDYLRREDSDKIKASLEPVFPVQTITNIPNNDFPIDFFPFKDGYLVQYWDHVDYIDSSGHAHILVKGEEIARVRTYPSYSVYSSYVTIATEEACWIFRIKDLSSSPLTSKSSSPSPYKKITGRHARGITE